MDILSIQFLTLNLTKMSTVPNGNDTPKVILGSMAAMLLVVAIAITLFLIFKDSINW